MRKFFRVVSHNRRKKCSENPSVTDYPNTRSLEDAMGAIQPTTTQSSPPLLASSTDLSEGHQKKISKKTLNGNRRDFDQPMSLPSTLSPPPAAEWKLPLVDESVSEPQSMEQEVKRLQALQSYFILDAPAEVEFDRITQMASLIFKAPTTLVSLVDLGRQWILSRVGLDATETARKHAFCAHVILNKYNILVVPDATRDVRFQDNPLVTDGIKIRFYAGAALVSPEGYKLGTLCIIDYKPRPQGLNATESQLLTQLADTVVSTMVARRNRMLRDDYETRLKHVTHTMVETTSALEQSRQQVDQIWDKNQWNMDQDDMREWKELSQNLGMQSRICKATTRNVLREVFEQQHGSTLMSTTDTAGKTKASSNEANFGSVGRPKSHNKDKCDGKTALKPAGDVDDEACANSVAVSVQGSSSSTQSSSENVSLLGPNINDDFWEDTILDFDNIVNPVADMEELFHNLNDIVGKFPFRNRVVVELHKSVPRRIVVEDLLLFRSVLNLLTHCMGRQDSMTSNNDVKNSALSWSGLTIETSTKREFELVVKAAQRGQPVSQSQANEWFQNPDSLLAPVASMVRSMGGKCGMYEGLWKYSPHSFDEKEKMDDENNILPAAQSIFWFQIPYGISETDEMKPRSENQLERTLFKMHTLVQSTPLGERPEHQGMKNGIGTTADPFQSALLQVGCGGH